MLNNVIIMGRITQDLELRQTPNGVSTLSFNVAVDRNYSGKDGQRQTDFITCVAWRQQAEFISKYFAKGRMIAIVGNLRSRTYDDKNGTKHYVTEVYVESLRQQLLHLLHLIQTKLRLWQHPKLLKMISSTVLETNRFNYEISDKTSHICVGFYFF